MYVIFERLLEMRGMADRLIALGAYVSPRVTNYWHPPLVPRVEVAQRLAEQLGRPEPGDIPGRSAIAWGGKATYAGRRDRSGLPIDTRSGEVFVIDAAQYVLGLFDAGVHLSAADQSRLALGLLDLGEETDLGLRFRCLTPAYGGAVPSGWKSAMAQGQVASALLRLGRQDEALAAIREMCGESDYLSSELGSPALRECAQEHAGIVLNGHLLALLGLYETAVAVPEMRPELERFVPGLPELVDPFISGCWSYYELGGTRRRTLASAFYHRLHHALLVTWSILADSPHLEALAQTCALTDYLPFRVEALGRRLTR